MLAALAGELEQLGMPGLGDLVDRQQRLDVKGTDAHLGRLDPRDRRGRQIELLRNVLDGQAGALTEAAQDPGQPALLHRHCAGRGCSPPPERGSVAGLIVHIAFGSTGVRFAFCEFGKIDRYCGFRTLTAMSKGPRGTFASAAE
jgi:hypothetical protein